MKAVNIKWDTDGEIIELPKEIKIPDDILGEAEDEDIGEDIISDYITDVTGFCHFGFDIEY